MPGASFGGREQKRYKFGKAKRNIIKTLDLLVIDEISMVRADLLDAVDSVMRRYRAHNLPFGGVQLLLIGDLQQLAPVVKDDEWEMMKSYYDTPFFFSSKALNNAGYHTIELQKVYRQQDSSFLALLNSIRENRADDRTLAELAGVASKFGEQYRCLLDINPDTAHPLLQERVHKATGSPTGGRLSATSLT